MFAGFIIGKALPYEWRDPRVMMIGAGPLLSPPRHSSRRRPGLIAIRDNRLRHLLPHVFASDRDVCGNTLPQIMQRLPATFATFIATPSARLCVTRRLVAPIAGLASVLGDCGASESLFWRASYSTPMRRPFSNGDSSGICGSIVISQNKNRRFIAISFCPLTTTHSKYILSVWKTQMLWVKS